MPRKNPPTGTDADLNLTTLAAVFTDESKARAFVESKRWPDGPVCPRCGHTDVYTLTAKKGSKSPVRPGVYKCPECRRNDRPEQFTVRIGTVFEESKLPLGKWLMAIHMMTASKKGVSSHQIARQLGITQKSAWFLCMRIREAMKSGPLLGPMKGTIEADETYIGPKHERGRFGRSTKGKKSAVVVLVERGGRARAVPLDRVTSNRLREHIRANVDLKNTRLMTDEYRSYIKVGKECEMGHNVIRHKDEIYAIGDVYTNTAESFFSLLKRGVHGIFHRVSKQHLERYCDEFSFRWSHRKISDGHRMVAALLGAEGKRLMYVQPRSA